MSAEGIADRVRVAARDAWRHLRAAPWVAAVAALNLGAALVSGALLFFVIGQSSVALDAVADDLTATIYLDEGVTPDAIEGLQAIMEEKVREGVVERATYFTADQEQERIVGLLSADLLEGVDEAAIPSRPVVEARLAVGTLDRERFETLETWVKALRQRPGVEDVAFAADHVGVLFAVGDLIGLAGWVLAPILLIAAIFFLSLLVRRALVGRAEELALMRALGATEATVYAPFFVAGGVLGLIGAAVAGLIATLIDGRLAALAEAAPNLGLDLGFAGGGQFVTFAIVGAGLGVVGAWASVARDRRGDGAR